MAPKDKYTDPKLREQVKKEVQESDKGGEPGQWSARKAQMMAKEYKKRGGDYTTDKQTGQDESQKSLEKWGDEDWQTKDGSGEAKTEDGRRQRYLPKKAWEKMSEKEKKETDEKKLEGSGEGKQFVGNTDKAKKERKKVNDERKEDDGADEVNAEDDQEEDRENQAEKPPKAGQKRKANANGKGNAASTSSQKKQKSNSQDHEDDDQSKRRSSRQQASKGRQGNAPPGKVGSKHMDATEPGPRGSSDRLPKKGDQITWKAMPGYVDGEVVEVVTSNKKVQGKDVKGTKSDPKLVLKSRASGKICVHKPEACFYD